MLGARFFCWRRCGAWESVKFGEHVKPQYRKTNHRHDNDEREYADERIHPYDLRDLRRARDYPRRASRGVNARCASGEIRPRNPQSPISSQSGKSGDCGNDTVVITLGAGAAVSRKSFVRRYCFGEWDFGNCLTVFSRDTKKAPET